VVRFLYLSIVPKRASMADELIDRAYAEELYDVRFGGRSSSEGTDDPFIDTDPHAIGKRLLSASTLDRRRSGSGATSRSATPFARFLLTVLIAATVLGVVLYQMLSQHLISVSLTF